MRHLVLIIMLAVVPISHLAAEAAGDLYVLAVALNQSPDKKAGQTIDSWNYCAEEIEKVLHGQANPFHRNVQVKKILGVKATRDEVLGGLNWLGKSAVSKNDLVFLYIGCHGGTDRNEGWGVESADGKQIWGHEIKTVLGKLPCPALVMLSTCGSGGFANAHKDDPPVPPNVTAFCACSGKQTTGNQIDMSVNEGLCGRADFNRDGVVDLDELIRYVQLRYKEWWPDPKSMDGIQTPIILKAKTVAGTFPLTKVSRDLVHVVHDGEWYAGLRQTVAENKYNVFLLGYDNKPGPGTDFITNSVTREFICLPEDGAPMKVEQQGRWYPARLLKMEGANYRVHYIGYNETEVVPKQRVFYPFVGDPEHPNYPYFITGNAGGWTRLGMAGAWKDTQSGTILKGRLYTVESNGCLFVTDLTEGTWEQIGKADYRETVKLYALGEALIGIEKNGDLYRIDPKEGSRKVAGAKGAWKNTLAGAVLNDRLYTVEVSGVLHSLESSASAATPIGKGEFANTAYMVASGDKLYTIEKDGTLYRVNPGDGGWMAVGEPQAWKNTQAAATVNGRLYSIESNGCLYATDLNTGVWKQVGKAEFGGTVFMFGANNRLYTIEKDGSLYSVSVK